LARSGTKNHHNSLIKKKQQQQQQQFRGRYSPIGLDLGSNQIKIVQLQNNRGAVATRLKVTTTTPHGSIVDGQIVKKEVLIAKLKLVRTKLNIHGKKVNTALSPSVCSMRLVKLPPLTAKEIRKAMNWEVEKHFSLSPSEAIYDYCPARLNPVAVNGQTDYILAAVSRGIVDAYAAAVSQAGFILATLEVQPLSLMRSNFFLLDQMGCDLPPTILMLDIGYQQSTLLFTHKQAYCFQQTLNFSLEKLIRIFIDNKVCASDHASRLLFQSPPAATTYLETAYAQLAVQLTRSREYWFEQIGLDNSSPLGLMLSGGGAAVPGLGHYISKRLSAQLFYHQLPVNSNNTKDKKDKGCSSGQNLFAAAKGLALRGWLR
jgi:type IV pilus assembly protein PilM